ncbi:hypothetical protein B0H10DRAFT_2071046 [Mycena sp. CBHHK59/15]|nr:hypothetical protein B0H10DRAFT_2071046 [Mycena sp. CBHHK59/15]
MTGCFSWCPWNRGLNTRSFASPDKSSSKNNQVKPTNTMYMIRGGKTLASVLETLSGLSGVPFLSEFVKAAGAVLEACEGAIAIEENVKDLQERVCHLTLTIVDTISVDGTASKELESSIQGLRSILDDIIKDLAEIKEQKKWILIFFRDLNKDRIGKCVDRVDAAVEQFHISHQLRVEELLDRIWSKYSDVTVRLSDVATKLDRIEQVVKSTNQPHNAPETLPRKDIPPQQPIFYGRQPFVDNIASLLANENTSRVCITGPGGMGKTSVALAVIESTIINQIFPKKYQFWVPCVEAKSADLLRRILYTQLRVTADSYDSLDTLINELDASQERRVLLLDNFETPWLSGHDQDQVRDILGRLAKLPRIALLVTMTSEFPPSKVVEWQHHKLPSLDAAAARDTFGRLYPGAADAPKLDELLNAIGHIPLAITLMAADGECSGTSPEDLLEQWQKSGTEMISHPGVSQSMDRTIGMSMNREIVKSNPGALTLLAILSMLPAGTTRNNLRWWAPTLTSLYAAIITLRTAALVEQEDRNVATSRIFVRPTIQSYMSQQNRISAEVQQIFVLEHKSTPDDAKFKADQAELASEESNIQGLLMQINVQCLRPNALEALIAFSLYQLSIKSSTVVALHALDLALTAQDDRSTAEAHHCLGKLFLRLARYEDACQHFEAARLGFKSLPDGGDLPRAGECSMELAETWKFMDHTFKSSDEIRSLVLDAQADLSHDAGKSYHVARGLLGLGNFMWWSNCPDNALEKFTAAKAIFDELECPASSSECLNLTARIYAARKEYAKALPIAREALTKAEQSGDSSLIGQVLRNNARCLIAFSSYDEALAMVERSLAQSQALGSLLGIAQNLELLAYTCAAKMHLSAARVAYEGARVQFANFESIEMGGSGVGRCTDNLKQLDGLTEINQTDFTKMKKPWPLY